MPGKIPDTIKLEPFAAKSLYVTAAVASNTKLLMKFFDAIDKTELNAIVIDLKSDLRDDLGPKRESRRVVRGLDRRLGGARLRARERQHRFAHRVLLVLSERR